MNNVFSYTLTRVGTLLVATAFISALFVASATPARADENNTLFPRAMATTYVALHTIQEKLSESAPLLQLSVSSQIASLLAQIEQLTAQLLQLQAQQGAPSTTQTPVTTTATGPIGNLLHIDQVRVKTAAEFNENPKGNFIIIGEFPNKNITVYINIGSSPVGARTASVVSITDRVAVIEAGMVLQPDKEYYVRVTDGTGQATTNGSVAWSLRPSISDAWRPAITQSSIASVPLNMSNTWSGGLSDNRLVSTMLGYTNSTNNSLVQEWRVVIECPANVTLKVEGVPSYNSPDISSYQTYLSLRGQDLCNRKFRLFNNQYGGPPLDVFGWTRAKNNSAANAQITYRFEALGATGVLFGTKTETLSLTPATNPTNTSVQTSTTQPGAISPTISMTVNGTPRGLVGFTYLDNFTPGNTITMTWDVTPKTGVVCTSRADQDIDAGVNGTVPGSNIPLQGTYTTPPLFYAVEFEIACTHTSGGFETYRVVPNSLPFLGSSLTPPRPSGTVDFGTRDPRTTGAPNIANNGFNVLVPNYDQPSNPLNMQALVAGVENEVRVRAINMSKGTSGTVLRYTHTGTGATGSMTFTHEDTHTLTNGEVLKTYSFKMTPANNPGWITFNLVNPDGKTSYTYATYVHPKPEFYFSILPGNNTSTTAEPTVTSVQTPTIISISPSTGTVGQQTTFTILGTNFQQGAVVKYTNTTTGGSGTLTPKTITATSITLDVTPGAAGSLRVYVQNQGGGISGTQTVTIQSTTSAPQPVITSATPTTAKVGDRTTFSITGYNFQQGAVVKYTNTTTGGSGTLTPSYVGRYMISLTFSPGRAGTIEYYVENPDGGKSTNRTITITE